MEDLFEAGWADWHGNHIDLAVFKTNDLYRGGWMAAATQNNFPVDSGSTSSELRSTTPQGSMTELFGRIYAVLPAGWGVKFWKFEPLFDTQEGFSNVVYIYDENGTEVFHEKHLQNWPIERWDAIIEHIKNIAASPTVN